jgi:hypothetical protein
LAASSAYAATPCSSRPCGRCAGGTWDKTIAGLRALIGPELLAVHHAEPDSRSAQALALPRAL